MIFSQIIGQAQAIELLKSAIASQKIAPAYLFSGPEGVGRYLTALEFTTLLLRREENFSVVRQKVQHGNHPDLLIIEPTYLHQGKLLPEAEAEAEGLKRKSLPQIRVEQVREVTRFLSRPPLEADRAVIIINSAHTMAESAANALLKTLEEPGSATLILIALSADSLLPTLVSRCHRIPFSRLGSAELKQVLTNIGKSEIIEKEAVFAMAQGSPGAAIKATENLESIPSPLLKQLENLIHSSEKSFLTNLEQGFSLAEEITKTLDFQTQVWLIDYLQQEYWESCLNGEFSSKIEQGLQQLETSRQLLLNYVQPRLVWEVTLWEILKSKGIC